MPIYEYQCASCGTFEVTQKITDKPLRRCPTCKGKVSKLISSTSFQLKGSGWYVTDYSGKKGGESSSTDAKDSKPSDSKPKAEGSDSKGGGDKPAKKEASAA